MRTIRVGNIDQRYYASAYGRFNTVDSGAVSTKNPTTWNRYSYSGGDPINRNDPGGSCWMDASGNVTEDWDYDPEYDFGDMTYSQGGCFQGPEYAADLASCTQTGGVLAYTGGGYGCTPPVVLVAQPAQPPPCDPGYLGANDAVQGTDGLVFSGADIDIGAAAVFAESNANWQGQLAVAAVLYNRIENPNFSHGALTSLTQVVTAPCQFVAVAPCGIARNGGGPSERFLQAENYQQLSPADCNQLSAAIEAMITTVIDGAAYTFTSFHAVGAPGSSGAVIGGNVFYGGGASQ